MVMENRIVRKTMTALLFLLFTTGCVLFGFYLDVVGWYWWVFGLCILVIGGLLHVSIAYDAILTNREERVEV